MQDVHPQLDVSQYFLLLFNTDLDPIIGPHWNKFEWLTVLYSSTGDRGPPAVHHGQKGGHTPEVGGTAGEWGANGQPARPPLRRRR